ncbi:hypothetical protein FALBO_9015 [Fusarium albosuccineum]|uniref:Uncharacterized protein n=1 Tax=Fusarium albosuccineum TaxID=1237068 RepID=A0A8H4L8K8_9HYPO|nr:hypothetical protein FALBO_9015 [Fusarium albosuccineum]
MANPLMSTSIPLGQWVDTLLDTIFCQSDDALAMSTYEQFVSVDLFYRQHPLKRLVSTVSDRSRINHDQYNYTQLYETFKEARKKNVIKTQSNDEVHRWDAPEGNGAGCVAHMSHFTLTNKETGEETKCSSLTLANVRVNDGKRMLVELTEVLN